MELPDEPVRLGKLIDLLQHRPQSDHIVLDFCDLRPTTLRSWRGNYRWLAVGYDDKTETTVAQLLSECRSALHTNFEGYKGGSYIMTGKTPVMVAPWGEIHSTGIVGVSQSTDVGLTILHTGYIN